MFKSASVYKLVWIACCVALFSLGMLSEQGEWKEWLREVEPIISKAEKAVFEDLRTEEDRARFVRSFWKIRDPNPETTENEYKLEYYRRLSYVEKKLGGTRSDQGRIYMILGKPAEIGNYTGSEQVVDAEMWTYYAEGRPGLPPVMNLIFYRKENVGKYRLYYPGMDSPMDILNPGYGTDSTNSRQAYNKIRETYAELADATLSVIPGEGSPYLPASSTSSSRVFAQIYTLPEKEASDSYLRAFQSLEGRVDVTYSFKEMPGTASLALSENRGYTFLNYSVMPDAIHLLKIGDNLHSAKLTLNLRIEDTEGRTIYQQEKNIEFKLDDAEKEALAGKKIMFAGFAPVIAGTFNVNIMLTNKTTEEFLTHEEKLKIDEAATPVLVGFKTEEIKSDRFLPYSTEKYKISVDPRFAFNKTDSLVGLVFTEKKPDIRLIPVDDEEKFATIADVVPSNGYFIFRKSLADVRSSNYFLSIKAGDREVYRKLVSVLPFLAEKPKGYEWSDPPTSGPAYSFEIGTEYLNQGNISASLEYFERLPEAFLNSFTIPTIARAYYQNKNYEKVLSLLERDHIPKNYSILFLLGNSSLELRNYEKAAGYFEELRNYGDTVQINQVLGAIYLSTGDREKAKVYFERAKALAAKPEEDKK